MLPTLPRTRQKMFVDPSTKNPSTFTLKAHGGHFGYGILWSFRILKNYLELHFGLGHGPIFKILRPHIYIKSLDLAI